MLIIQSVKLDHSGGIYIYRLHTLKTEKLCKDHLLNLRSYLYNVFQHCPNQYFHSGPRGSALKFRLPVTLTPIPGHEISTLARWGLEQNKDRFKYAHPKVQTFLLENDNNTVAMEVPLWIEQHEMDDYVSLFNTIQPLTGHIDVLRVEGDKVWVWDYKPKAEKEKFAATQVYFYSQMLSKRTGISLEHFRCGYFDDRYAYAFKPEDGLFRKNERLVSS